MIISLKSWVIKHSTKYVIPLALLNALLSYVICTVRDREKDEVIVGVCLMREDGRFFNRTINIVELNASRITQGITVDCQTVENRCHSPYQGNCYNVI